VQAGLGPVPGMGDGAFGSGIDEGIAAIVGGFPAPMQSSAMSFG
jgi:hypothetical protein